MLIEIGHAMASGVPFIIASKADASYSHLMQLSNGSFEWEDLDDLAQKINKQMSN